MNKNLFLGIGIGAIAIVICFAIISCARPIPTPVQASTDCPPGAKYCVAPKVPAAKEEVGADATKIGQILEPTTARIRVYYAGGAPPNDTEAVIAPGVWLVPEDAIEKTEVVK